MSEFRLGEIAWLYQRDKVFGVCGFVGGYNRKKEKLILTMSNKPISSLGDYLFRNFNGQANSYKLEDFELHSTLYYDENSQTHEGSLKKGDIVVIPEISLVDDVCGYVVEAHPNGSLYEIKLSLANPLNDPKAATLSKLGAINFCSTFTEKTLDLPNIVRLVESEYSM
ncbi:hypothetical protein KY347_07025 [Candidatus Woesearchaeota archaeon]|nr:hypothetical protein [Candidatus Woesearchaeota archaeon]